MPQTIHEKTAELRDKVAAAKAELKQEILRIQAGCDHPTLLKYTSGDYLTTRACEECGYHESVQWDSPYKYQDQRLLGRAYEVSWAEITKACV